MAKAAHNLRALAERRTALPGDPRGATRSSWTRSRSPPPCLLGRRGLDEAVEVADEGVVLGVAGLVDEDGALGDEAREVVGVVDGRAARRDRRAAGVGRVAVDRVERRVVLGAEPAP